MEKDGLGAWGSKALLWIGSLVLMAFTITRTLHFLQQTFPPNQEYVAYLGLAAFDLGVLYWLYYSTNAASGNAQRGISYGMVFVCLGGVIATTVADMLLVSAQNGLNDKLPPQLSTTGLWVVMIVISLNVAAFILVHLFDPKHRQHMVMEKSRAKIQKAVFAAIESKADEISPEIAAAAAIEWQRQTIAEMIGFLPTTSRKIAPSVPSGKVVTGTISKPKTKQLPSGKKTESKNLKKSSKNLKQEAVSLTNIEEVEEELEELEDEIEEEEEDTEVETDDEIEEEEDTGETPEPTLADAANIVKKKVLRALPRRR